MISKEAKKEYMQKYYEANKEKLKQNMRAYYSKYYPENKEKISKYNIELEEKKRMTVFNHYCKGDVKCQCCGERETDFLTVDHINQDGYLHRRKGVHICRLLIHLNFPEGYQILCYNCNCARSFRGKGICPHKRNLEEAGHEVD